MKLVSYLTVNSLLYLWSANKVYTTVQLMIDNKLVLIVDVSSFSLQNNIYFSFIKY